MTKLELLHKIINKENVDRLPTAFWFHYLENEVVNAFENTSYIKKSIDGHKAYIEKANPDLVKIMTDGFFLYNNNIFSRVSSVKDLYNLKPLALDDKWYDMQLEFASRVIEPYKQEIPFIYNLFSFTNTFRFSTAGYLDKLLVNLYRLDKQAFAHANAVVSHDLATLASRLIKEVGVTGIYLCVRNTQGLTKNEYLQDVIAQEQDIINQAKTAGGINVLHICGYEGFRNDLSIYDGFNVDIVNYASTVEGIPLKEAKARFKNSIILGGFDNTTNSILYTGNIAKIKSYTKALIDDFGSDFIIGADCSLPRDIKLENLKAVQEAAIKNN